MKKLFLILGLANVIFLALMQLGGLGWGEPVAQEQAPLHEEKIRLRDKSEPIKAPSLPARIPAESAPSADLHLSMSMAVPAVSEQNAPTCLEWGDFSGQDLARATTALSVLSDGDEFRQNEIEQDAGYWVYIPPLKNKGAVNKKTGELREMGVKDYFVVSNAGRWRNAISLGVFKTRDAAQNFLDQLRTKGVRSAQIGERTSKLKTTRFMLSVVNAETKAKLIEIQKEFAGSELVNVPCALTRESEIRKMPRSLR